MSNLSVQILVTVPKPEHFDACTLCFDTLRVGFPTAQIEVEVNGTCGLDAGLEDLLFTKAAAAAVKTLRWHSSKVHAGYWIRQQVERATGPLVILDADTIFWKSCEGWTFPDETLLAGYYVPKMWNDFAKCISMPRLHTSLLFMPNPPALRQRIRHAYTPAQKAHGEYCPCDPYMPAVQFINGHPYFWDCCANLYGMLTNLYVMRIDGVPQVYPFGLSHLACYDHLNSASFFDVMLDRLDGDKEGFAYIHRFAVKEPAKLKNLWPLVNQYYQAKAAQAVGKSLCI